MRPDEAIYIPWAAWYASWVIAARWSNATVKRPSSTGQALVYFFEIGGFFTLIVLAGGSTDVHVGIPVLDRALWTLSVPAKWAMVGVATLGFLFCWWARIHLGRLWSGFITRKEGHRVIDTGPYRIVRHPIYMGVLIAAAATMLTRGTGIAVAGFAMLLLGFFIKAKLEERFLRSELGSAAYDAYARRTAMLVPFVRL